MIKAPNPPNVDSSTVIINWSYRLKPNKQQIFGINKTLKICCDIYNICVDLDRTIYEETKIGISADDLSNYLKDDNIGDELHATVRQSECNKPCENKSVEDKPKPKGCNNKFQKQLKDLTIEEIFACIFN